MNPAREPTQLQELRDNQPLSLPSSTRLTTAQLDAFLQHINDAQNKSLATSATALQQDQLEWIKGKVELALGAVKRGNKQQAAAVLLDLAYPTRDLWNYGEPLHVEAMACAQAAVEPKLWPKPVRATIISLLIVLAIVGAISYFSNGIQAAILRIVLVTVGVAVVLGPVQFMLARARRHK